MRESQDAPSVIVGSTTVLLILMMKKCQKVAWTWRFRGWVLNGSFGFYSETAAFLHAHLRREFWFLALDWGCAERVRRALSGSINNFMSGSNDSNEWTSLFYDCPASSVPFISDCLWEGKVQNLPRGKNLGFLMINFESESISNLILSLIIFLFNLLSRLEV